MRQRMFRARAGLGVFADSESQAVMSGRPWRPGAFPGQNLSTSTWAHIGPTHVTVTSEPGLRGGRGPLPASESGRAGGQAAATRPVTAYAEARAASRAYRTILSVDQTTDWQLKLHNRTAGVRWPRASDSIPSPDVTVIKNNANALPAGGPEPRPLRLGLTGLPRLLHNHSDFKNKPQQPYWLT